MPCESTSVAGGRLYQAPWRGQKCSGRCYPGGSLPSLPGGESSPESTSSVSMIPFSVQLAPCCQPNCGPWIPSTLLRRDGSERTWLRSSPTISGWQLPLDLWATKCRRLPDRTDSGPPPAPAPAGELVAYSPSLTRHQSRDIYPAKLGGWRAAELPEQLADASEGCRQTARFGPAREDQSSSETSVADTWFPWCCPREIRWHPLRLRPDDSHAHGDQIRARYRRTETSRRQRHRKANRHRPI
jgi:hypothetical protein